VLRRAHIGGGSFGGTVARWYGGSFHCRRGCIEFEDLIASMAFLEDRNFGIGVQDEQANVCCGDKRQERDRVPPLLMRDRHGDDDRRTKRRAEQAGCLPPLRDLVLYAW